jgi:hypothetical protein
VDDDEEEEEEEDDDDAEDEDCDCGLRNNLGSNVLKAEREGERKGIS